MLGEPSIVGHMNINELSSEGITPQFLLSILDDTKDSQPQGFFNSMLNQSLQDALTSVKLCIEADAESAMRLDGGTMGAPVSQPEYIHMVNTRLKAQLLINASETIVGIPKRHTLVCEPHEHADYEWWVRTAINPWRSPPDVTFEQPELAPGTPVLRLVSSQGKHITLEIGACVMSTTLQYFIRNYGTHDAIPLPTVGTIALQYVVTYCRQYMRREPIKITHPLLSNNLLECGASLWDMKFLNMQWTTLFDVILAANYLGIPSLLHLTCAKVAATIMGSPLEEIILQLQWSDIDELTNMMQLYCRRQEASAPARVVDPQMGDLVRIHGLKNPIASKMNGLLGQVVAVFPESDRRGVEVCRQCTVQKSVRTQNLQVIPLNTSVMVKRALAWYAFWLAETM